MTEKTYFDHQLDELRARGVKVHAAKRTYRGTMLSDDNALVFADWINTWARNAAVNYPLVSRACGINMLAQSAFELPVVVAGIGPSLDDALPDLRRARSNIILIATDAALRPMVAAGVNPDLVVNYDCRPEQCSMWDTVDTSLMVLLANSCTAPETINAWKGRILFFNMMQSDDPFCMNVLPAIYPNLGDLAALGTVGNGAVLLAAAMRASKIITIGMDLCYKAARVPADQEPPAPRYRCSDFIKETCTPDFPDGRWAPVENKTLYENAERVKGLKTVTHGDQPFYVDDALDHYQKSLNAAIKTFNLPIVDCSDGVLGKYVEALPLAEAIEKYAFDRILPGRSIVRHLFPLLHDLKADQ